MEFKRIRLSEASTIKLRTFKARTGITPNIACRMALTLSLSEHVKPALELHNNDDSGQEINRYTLMGEHELILLSLFQLWCHSESIDNGDKFDYFMAHINRGVELVYNRIKSIDSINELVCDFI